MQGLFNWGYAMSAVNFFDSFLYKWAQTGSVVTLQDDQYKVGWSFIGSVPPSVEQFNAWGQLSDEKHNWLFGQLKTAADEKGVTLTGASLGGLLQILNKTAPNASTTVKGIAELATNAETQAGTDAARVVTPAGLSSRTATTARTGLIQLATAAEAKALADALLAITPTTLSEVLADYATNTALTSGLSEKANTSHTHTISQIAGLQGELNKMLGVGQGWADAIPYRSANTLYTNTSGRSIGLSVTSAAVDDRARISVEIDGKQVARQSAGPSTGATSNFATVSLIVPNGSTYRVRIDGSFGEEITHWMELTE